MGHRRLTPAESLFVGDTMEDYHAANACGVEAVFLAHGYGRERILAEAPDRTVYARAAMISEEFLRAETIGAFAGRKA
jgi:phosphoglycolate phosphatase-like HAD superfamily hydrolase